jgi:outer membrane protein
MKHPKALLVFFSTLFGFNIQVVSANDVSPWMVRFRVQHVSPANKSTAIHGLAEENAMHISKKTQPEMDLSYFFTPNLAAEFALNHPEKHHLRVNRVGEVGNFKYFSPILSLQYHINPHGDFKPYLGVGMAHTRFSSVKLHAPDKTSISLGGHHHTGPVIGVGFDYRISQNLYFNMDAKKSSVRADMSANNASFGSFKINPTIVSVGLGLRF